MRIYESSDQLFQIPRDLLFQPTSNFDTSIGGHVCQDSRCPGQWFRPSKPDRLVGYLTVKAHSINKRVLVVFALLIAVLLAVVLFRSPPQEWDRARRFGEYIESLGATGMLVFIVIAALATSVGLPRQLFAFAAGFSFGVATGVLLSSFAAIIGCAITFFCSRRWLTDHIQSRYPNVVQGLNELLHKDAFFKILVLRLQPLGTNLITNLCAGVTAMSAKLFLTSSWLGYLPQMLVFALFGAGVRIGSNAYLIYSLSMLGVSLLIGLWLYRRAISHIDKSSMSGNNRY